MLTQRITGLSRMSANVRALLAGVAGGVAYLAAQEVDRRVVNPRSNDLDLLGGMVTSNEAVWKPLGLVMHLMAGATFGLVFQHTVAPRLWGPYWLRGVLMAQFENATLWPLVLLLDRSHVAVQRGKLAPMNQPVYFLQAVWRHFALGAVMGWLLQPATAPDHRATANGRRA